METFSFNLGALLLALSFLSSSLLILHLEDEGDWTAEILECRGESPVSRSAHTCVLWNHTLFVFGGWNGAVTNDDFYKLNLSTHSSLSFCLSPSLIPSH